MYRASIIKRLTIVGGGGLVDHDFLIIWPTPVCHGHVVENWGGGGQSGFSDPDFGKINFHIRKIGKQFFANISLPDHFRAHVASYLSCI